MQKCEKRKKEKRKKSTCLDVLSQLKREGVARVALASSELDCLTVLLGSMSFERSLVPNASVILFIEVVLNVSLLLLPLALAPGKRAEEPLPPFSAQ